MRMVKKPLDKVGREGTLHCADSWGMAATEEHMGVTDKAEMGQEERGGEPGDGQTTSDC
jgi:hypothetical protein